MDALAVRDCQRLSPIASAIPSGTATTIVIPASTTLLTNAFCRSSLFASDPSSVNHHRNEKPCQLLRLRPSLNENATAISTGTIDHAM